MEHIKQGISPHDTVRRAAMVVASLHRAAADAVLERMPEHQAAAIRHAMMSLPEGGPEQAEAIRCFLHPPPPQDEPEPHVDFPGPRESLATSDPPESPLAALSYLETTAIARCLYHERASTISAILLALPGKQAAAVLPLMEAEKRTRILKNMGLGHQAYAPAVQAAATRILELCQSPDHLSSMRNTVQHESLREILDALDDQDQGELLAGLAEENPLLARRLQRES